MKNFVSPFYSGSVMAKRSGSDRIRIHNTAYIYVCVAGQALQGRRLEDLSVTELSQILSDVETLVRDLSEELVQDLGVRDELEFEKVGKGGSYWSA
jgi:hypothetical protein